MMCFSKELIYYSSEMKQYSLDVMVALLILLATVRCFEDLDARPQRRRLVVWGIVSGCTDLVSHPAVFVIAGTGLTLIFANRNRSWLAAIFAALIAALSFSIDYFAVLRPLRQSVYLHEFWQQGDFLPRPITFRSIAWVWKAFFLAFRTPADSKFPSSPQSFSDRCNGSDHRKPWLAAVRSYRRSFALGAAAARRISLSPSSYPICPSDALFS